MTESRTTGMERDETSGALLVRRDGELESYKKTKIALRRKNDQIDTLMERMNRMENCLERIMTENSNGN